MKRMTRIIAALMCIALLGMILCSCQQLDDKKRNHAVYTDDSKETIEFRGNNYKRLTLPSESIVPVTPYDYIGATAYVTTKDVPVLLSSVFGEEIAYDIKSDEPVVIQCYKESSIETNNNFLVNSTSVYGYQYDNEKCYVREDHFDELNEELKDGNLDHYYYYDYGTKDFELKDSDSSDEIAYEMNSDYEVKIDEKMIDDESTAAINETLKNGKKIEYNKLKNHTYSSFSLMYCDKNLLFTDTSKILIIFRDTTADKYYLASMAYDYANHKELIEAPEKYSQLFKKLFSENKNIVFEDDDLSSYFEYDFEDAEEVKEESDSPAIKL